MSAARKLEESLEGFDFRDLILEILQLDNKKLSADLVIQLFTPPRPPVTVPPSWESRDG